MKRHKPKERNKVFESIVKGLNEAIEYEQSIKDKTEDKKEGQD